MYLSLTEACNMACAHCCMSAKKRAPFMGMAVVERALKLAEGHETEVVLGGGEPTLHPEFLDILGKAIVATASSELYVLVVTNGTDKAITHKLLDLAAKEIIKAEVSQDEWHDLDMVDPEVRFRAAQMKAVRSVKAIVAQGRAKKISYAREGCGCETPIVMHDGAVWACGCKSQKLGNILDPNFDTTWLQVHECWESRFHPRHDMKETA